MTTQWKVIPYGNFDYEVNEYGEVYSHKSNKLLKSCYGRNGYERVCLYDGAGKSKYIFRHKLVLEAFGPEQPPNTTCDHIDRNINNNHISNLRWATRQEQAANSVGNGGVRHKMPIDIWLNGEFYARAKSLYAAEKLLNFPHGLIRDHLNKGTPTEKGFSFTIAEEKNEESEV